MFKLTRGIQSVQGITYCCPECNELVTLDPNKCSIRVGRNFEYRTLLDQCSKNHNVQVVVYWDILE